MLEAALAAATWLLILWRTWPKGEMCAVRRAVAAGYSVSRHSVHVYERAGKYVVLDCSSGLDKEFVSIEDAVEAFKEAVC